MQYSASIQSGKIVRCAQISPKKLALVDNDSVRNSACALPVRVIKSAGVRSCNTVIFFNHFGNSKSGAICPVAVRDADKNPTGIGNDHKLTVIGGALDIHDLNARIGSIR